MVDATNNTFLSYQGATLGLQSLLASAPGAGQVAYSSTGTGVATGLAGGTATVDVTASGALADNPNIYALRLGNVALTTATAAAVTGNSAAGSNVITNVTTTNLRVGQPVSGTGIPAGAVITAVGADSITLSNQVAQTTVGLSVTPSFAVTLASGGLILTSTADQSHTAPIAVPGELIVFRPNTGAISQLNGPIIATGITKFGLGDMRLGGDNRGTLTGDVRVSGDNWFRIENQYALGGSTTNPYAASNRLISNGGRFHSGNGLALLQTEFVLNQDTRVGWNNAILGSMTVNAYSGNSFGLPVVLNSESNNTMNVAGLTTLNGPLSVQVSATTHSVFLHGGLGGTGSLQKWGVGNLNIGGSSTYSQPVTVNQGSLVSSMEPPRSLSGTVPSPSTPAP